MTASRTETTVLTVLAVRAPNPTPNGPGRPSSPGAASRPPSPLAFRPISSPLRACWVEGSREELRQRWFYEEAA